MRSFTDVDNFKYHFHQGDNLYHFPERCNKGYMSNSSNRKTKLFISIHGIFIFLTLKFLTPRYKRIRDKCMRCKCMSGWDTNACDSIGSTNSFVHAWISVDYFIYGSRYQWNTNIGLLWHSWINKNAKKTLHKWMNRI